MTFFNTFIVFIDDALSTFEGFFCTKLIKMGFEVFTTVEPHLFQKLILT